MPVIRGRIHRLSQISSSRQKLSTSMFDLTKFILQIRPDLRILFPFKNFKYSNNYLSWLITTGMNEYQGIGEDHEFIRLISSPKKFENSSLTLLQLLVRTGRPDVEKAFPLPKMQKEFLVWFYTHGLEEHKYWQYLSKTEKKLVSKLPEPWKTRHQSLVSQFSFINPPIPFKKRGFGVNLIGYAFGQLGIGEDVRMAGRAFLETDVPMMMLDFPPGNDIGQNDRSMSAHVYHTGDFAFNIFCLTAEETGRYYAERGRSQLVDKYNIGYWPWELGSWPKEWEMLLDLVDEVWVSSQHTYDSISPVCKKPLYLMPMAVELGRVKKFSSFSKTRVHFKLPNTATLFCFAFDLKSYVDRKNPRACIDAFLEAFPKSEFKSSQVGLVVKVHKPSEPDSAWLELKKIARSDRRIHIIERTLDREELLALYKSCNCYVSLHRAEGFGRGMAEAIQLGLHVICTGYSGNIDFCKPPHADLVKYRLVRIKKDRYPHAKNQVWAEPNIKHAAQLMRQFYDSKKINTRPTEFSDFSPLVVGNKYKQRLVEIWANRNKSKGPKKLDLTFDSNKKN